MNGAMLLPELDHEMAGTRKALERIPGDRRDFRPHEKSWTLGQLAGHLALIPGWVPITLATTELDLAQPFPRPPLETKEEILAAFDASLAGARAALAKASADDLTVPWSLKQGGQVAFTLPRNAVLRSYVLNHNVHHRGQLTVYLRLVGASVPALYGPSGDEQA
ncbi:MAG: damage-inducible protein DinB [Gemmatimonadetes bacterium]|nr:damage-inducible protein DinB [Gemmatimonadota bacterium]